MRVFRLKRDERVPERAGNPSLRNGSLPDLLGTDSHFRKDIIRDLQGVISGIILDQAILRASARNIARRILRVEPPGWGIRTDRQKGVLPVSATC